MTGKPTRLPVPAFAPQGPLLALLFLSYVVGPLFHLRLIAASTAYTYPINTAPIQITTRPVWALVLRGRRAQVELRAGHKLYLPPVVEATANPTTTPLPPTLHLPSHLSSTHPPFPPLLTLPRPFCETSVTTKGSTNELPSGILHSTSSRCSGGGARCTSNNLHNHHGVATLARVFADSGRLPQGFSERLRQGRAKEG